MTLAGVPLWAVLVVGLVVLVGAFVQSTVGLGLGMLGAPLVALVEPSLVPTLLLLLAIPVSLGVTVVERHHVDWRVVGWMLPSRVPGTVLGVWLVTAFSDRVLGTVVGVLVLAAVALTVRTVTVPQNVPTLVLAGFASGTTGTAAAIGAPPVALVLSGRDSRVVRGTMSGLFVIGAVLSVAWFGAVGELPAASLLLGLLYLPMIPLALWLGTRAHLRIPRRAFRRVVLGLCTASAVALLARSALG